MVGYAITLPLLTFRDFFSPQIRRCHGFDQQRIFIVLIATDYILLLDAACKSHACLSNTIDLYLL